jgi:hypothetical protein
VLLPGSLLPRRADAADVVGAALRAHAGGSGSRTIAADLRRPLATVRRWLRAVGGRHAQWLHTRAAWANQFAQRLTNSSISPGGSTGMKGHAT